MNKNHAFIIFGGTGDLTKRKLIPAIYNLLDECLLPDSFFVVAVGRREKTSDEFRDEMCEAVKTFSRNKYHKLIWEQLRNRIYYYQLDFNGEQDYITFDLYLSDLEKKYQTENNRMYYLAVSPEYFGVIAERLQTFGLVKKNEGYQRVLIEKPFGKDLASAKDLSTHITQIFSEENTYRIDHYLGKEMLQNVLVIRFANAIFEPIWNNAYIDHVQITSTETLGIDERGGYYDQSGALKDMFQNHLLQFLALIAMEPPERIEAEKIRDEKVEVFKAMHIFSDNEVKENVVRGQYAENKERSITGYRQGSRVPDDSNTETFVALKIAIENERWKGVPFYIRTGKQLSRKSVEVVLQFKPRPLGLMFCSEAGMIPNQLIIRIQPTEGVFLRFNAKKPGQGNDTTPVGMDFCQNCSIGYNSPEAYEHLLYGAMKGDKTLFTRWDEIEYSWRFVDAIKSAWDKEQPDFPNYVAGSDGPEAADQLMAKDGRQWLNES